MSDKNYKEQRIAALIRKMIIALFDIVLLTVSNYMACYITMNGSVGNSGYASIAYSTWHIAIFAVACVIVNFSFGLYNSVWSFAGVDEIVRGVCSATVIDLILLFIDRVLFEDVLKIEGRMPIYSYMLCWMFFVFCIAGIRVAYRILRDVPSQVIAKSSKNERVMIVGAGFMGNFVIEMLRNDNFSNGRPIIAVDDNPAKLRKKNQWYKGCGQL